MSQRFVLAARSARSQVAIVFNGPFQNTPVNRLLIKTMGEMLGGNLHHVLREELGGTYGVNVDSRFSKFPTSEYQISIGFSCDPARLKELTDAAWNEIRTFAERGPSAEFLASVRTQVDRDLENGYQENADLLNDLLESVENGEDLANVFNQKALYDQVTVAALRNAAREYLNLKRYVQVTQRPEGR